MKSIFLLATLAALAPLTSAKAQTQSVNIQNPMEKAGFESIRGVETDLCFPANGDEYQALGKNAVLRLDSSSAMSAELPLKSVYFVKKGVRVPLRRIAVLDKYEATHGPENRKNTYTHQVSFYLIPVSLLKTDARLMVDFTGDRSEFGVGSFGKDSLANAPAFVRLDEYDTPSEPDEAALTMLLVREYPDQFARSE